MSTLTGVVSAGAAALPVEPAVPGAGAGAAAFGAHALSVSASAAAPATRNFCVRMGIPSRRGESQT